VEDRRGAACVIGSYDPQVNLVYYGASNDAPWGAGSAARTAAILASTPISYTASTAPLDADTGQAPGTTRRTPYDDSGLRRVKRAKCSVDASVERQKTPLR